MICSFGFVSPHYKNGKVHSLLGFQPCKWSKPELTNSIFIILQLAGFKGNIIENYQRKQKKC